MTAQSDLERAREIAADFYDGAAAAAIRSGLFDNDQSVRIALAALRSAGAWQPIESAPRDGTRILVIVADAFSPEANVGWWRGDSFVSWLPAEKFFAGGVTPIFATHWMALPAPPASQETQG